MPPWQSASQVSSGSLGTRRSPSSTRIRIFPICGPLPCVITNRQSLWKSGFRCSRVSTVCSNCCRMVPGSPGRVMAFPPRAMTRVLGISLWLRLVVDFLVSHGQGHDRFRGMEAILRLVVNHRARAVDDLVRYFVAPVGGQRMHVESGGFCELHSGGIADPVLVPPGDVQRFLWIAAHCAQTTPALRDDHIGIAECLLHAAGHLELHTGAARIL